MMQFKITSFNIVGDDYFIDGVVDINWMYLRKYESYKGHSFVVSQNIAKKAKLGFNSNSTGSNDSMTWVRPADSGENFVKQIIKHSYISDDTFVWCYVDFYYNLNYIDVEKALDQDINNQTGIIDNGIESIAKIGDKNKTGVLYLTNDQSVAVSNIYFDDYRVLNNSTEVSIRMGYRNRVKWYNINNKELLVFNVESLTTNSDTKVIMKGKPQDAEFFNEHTNNVYMGKNDTDNVHRNYQYSQISNYQNLEDITKIALELSLPTPNFNLYKFQKIKVIITNEATTPSHPITVDRLNGEWTIIEIRFRQSEGQFKQNLTLVKRELDLGKDEM